MVSQWLWIPLLMNLLKRVRLELRMGSHMRNSSFNFSGVGSKTWRATLVNLYYKLISRSLSYSEATAKPSAILREVQKEVPWLNWRWCWFGGHSLWMVKNKLNLYDGSALATLYCGMTVGKTSPAINSIHLQVPWSLGLASSCSDTWPWCGCSFEGDMFHGYFWGGHRPKYWLLGRNRKHRSWSLLWNSI